MPTAMLTATTTAAASVCATEEPESLMPWAPYIQQNFRMKNSDAYTNTYLD